MPFVNGAINTISRDIHHIIEMPLNTRKGNMLK